MDLTNVLAELRDAMSDAGTWAVNSLTRTNPDGSPSKRVTSFSIVRVSVNHDDFEIHLITDGRDEGSDKTTSPLTLSQLVAELEALETQCADYSVYSGSAWFAVDEDHAERVDLPLVGFAKNPVTRTFGFLQYPAEQWND